MKRNACLAAVAAFLVILAAVDTRAQVDPLERVTLDFNAAPPKGVFDLLARSLHCELALDPQIKQSVTIRMENVTARTALNAICESIGCQWRLEAGKLLVGLPGGGQTFTAVRPKDSLVTIERLRKRLPEGTRFENAPLGTVLQAISAAAGLEIQLEGADTSRTVTLDLSGQPMIDAIKQVVTLAKIEGPVMIGGFDEAKDKRFKIYIKGSDLKVTSKESKKEGKVPF